MSTESVKKDWEELSPLFTGCGLNWSYYREGSEIILRVSDSKLNELKLVFKNLEQAKVCIPHTLMMAVGVFAMTKQEEEDEEELP